MSKWIALLYMPLLSGCLLLTGYFQPLDCGDARLTEDEEECDDGNTTSGDGCDASCQLEAPRCGDGGIQSGELCDSINLNGESCESQGFTSGALACNATCDGFITGGCVDGNCGNGTLDNNEECDDSNTAANDGCNSACEFEADVFVLCGGGVNNGDGQLASPFNSLALAIADSGTNNGDVLMILPQSSGPCEGSGPINKDLTIQGFADPAAAKAAGLIRPTINGDANQAIRLGNGGSRVVVQDLFLEANRAGEVVAIANAVNELALLRVEIKNTNTAGVGLDCDGIAGSALLIDQSIVAKNAGGGMRIRGDCTAILANSLYLSNGNIAVETGPIELIENATLHILYSTFKDNHTLDINPNFDTGTVVNCSNAAQLQVDGSILFNDNTSDKDGDGVGETVNFFECASPFVFFTDAFGDPQAGGDNIDQDPLFVNADGDFHLRSGSPCIDTAGTFLALLPFDPDAIFGVDVFEHDFAGSPRPLGNAPDMGMFEDF